MIFGSAFTGIGGIDRGLILAKTGALAAGLALVVAPITAPAALLAGKKSQGFIVIFQR